MIPLAIVLIVSIVKISTAENCVSKDFGHGSIVCVCNSAQCHTLKGITRVNPPNYIRYTSDKKGQRFEEQTGTFEKSNDNAENIILIGTKTYQNIFGFGGAFTDATGINIKSLEEDVQEKLLRAYYSEEGLEYNVGRVPIGGADFSTHSYSYCDTENDEPDKELANFSLAQEDHDYKIPLIQKAQQLANGQIKLFGSTWIAPNWMRTIPDFMARKSFIKEEMYQTWADYLVKFLNSYKKEGINFWGITTGNEPLTGFIPSKVPSVSWYPDQMRKWIKENLGPTIRSSDFSDIKIMAIDDSGILLPWVVELLFLDKETKDYVEGIAVHWYMDDFLSPSLLNDTHNKFPDKFIFYTEACNGYLINNVVLGSWDRADRYASNIIRDLNSWSIGWVDWNMALNTQGGPTFTGNFVDSPIIVDAKHKEFYKQPSYYALGHFSKFIPRDSVVLQATSEISGVEVTAVKRPDEGTAVVILNRNNEPVKLTVRHGAQDAVFTVTPYSINSIVYW